MSHYSRLLKATALGSAGLFLLTSVAFAAAPVIRIILSGTNITAGNPTTIVGRFQDADAGDTHTAVWNWGDGNVTAGTVTEPSSPTTMGSVIDSHTYAAAGTYTLTLTVTDNNAETTQKTRSVVVNP